MNDREMEAWLAKIPVLTEPRTLDEEHELQMILGSKGLTVLLGLVLGARQAQFVLLSYQNMGSEDGRWRAAVTQGKIQGIELVIQTVRELAVSTKADSDNKEPR